MTTPAEPSYVSDPAASAPCAFAAPDPAFAAPDPAFAAPDPAFAAPDPAHTQPDAAFTPPIASAPPRPYRKIRRNRDDRMVAGVAGGLGRYVNVDPVLFRILFVVLTLFGGSGILLYLFAWIAVPEDGRDDAPISRLLNRGRRRRR